VTVPWRNGVMDIYKQVFGELPKKEQSPLDKDDHPEADTTQA